MAYANIVLENLLVCVALPFVVRKGVFAATGWLQDRPMFSIQFCYVLAASSGIAIGMMLMASADIINRITLAEIWKINGLWHHPRAYEMIVSNLQAISDSLPASQASRLMATLWAFVAATTFFNVVIAILGWRSAAAMRGIAVHILLVLYYCAATVFVTLLLLWIVHWLNFWIFLVLLVVIEVRRREESGARLSF
ncbi:MAG: hypothetical protein ACO20O_07180 [Pseudomonadales bacterium]